MKRLIFVFLVLVATLIFFGCSENNSTAPELSQNDQMANFFAKPSPNLIGTQVANFTFTHPTYWNGTIDFGVVGKYSITYISLGPPRDYSQASPFEEEFIIYELGTDWTNPKNVYMKGWDAGVVTLANKKPEPSKVVANGKIEEAYGPFEMWQGRNVHGSGVVIWESDGSLPKEARVTFRIN